MSCVTIISRLSQNVINWPTAPRTGGSREEIIISETRRRRSSGGNDLVGDFTFVQPTNQMLIEFSNSSQPVDENGSKNSKSCQFLSNSCGKIKKSRPELLGESVQMKPRKYRYKMMDPLKNKKNSHGPKPMCFKKKLKRNPWLIKLPRTQKSADGVFNEPKRYTCHFCPDYEFYRLTAFLRHVRKYHKEELLVCELCQKEFTNPFVLQRHLRLKCRKL